MVHNNEGDYIMEDEYGNDCLICKELLADNGSYCGDCDYEYQCSHCELEMKHRGYGE